MTWIQWRIKFKFKFKFKNVNSLYITWSIPLSLPSTWIKALRLRSRASNRQTRRWVDIFDRAFRTIQSNVYSRHLSTLYSHRAYSLRGWRQYGHTPITPETWYSRSNWRGPAHCRAKVHVIDTKGRIHWRCPRPVIFSTPQGWRGGALSHSHDPGNSRAEKAVRTPN